MENEYHTTWFDPGSAATGWAHFVVDFHAFSRPDNYLLRNIKSWDCGEFIGSEAEIIRQCVALVADTVSVNGLGVSYMNYRVGSEAFELTQMVGGDNLLSPVRINAVLDWECVNRGIKPILLQSRTMRTSVTRSRLRAWGFDGRFRKDEFSAMQHGLVYLRRLKQESISRPWQLMSGGVINGGGWDCSCNRDSPRWVTPAPARPQLHDLVHP